jgi:DHA2 family multidrug resistance protein
MAEWRPSVNPWLIAISVMLPTFMEVLDTSIAAVALPHIAGSMSASTDEATWVLTSYLVANAVVLPASTWFSLRFGRRNFLLVCIILFTVSSFFCGAAGSLSVILIARALQGAGGGALQPLSQAILLESFPPAKRGSAMAMFALGVVVAPVLGPTLGGFLTEQYSWRWAFYINIPIGALALFMVSRFVEDPPYVKSAKPGRFDTIGFGLLIVWLGALQIVLDKGQEDDWFGSRFIVTLTVIAAAGFVVFLIQQLVDKHPITNLRVFCNRNFAIGCAIMAMLGAVIYGIVTILPLFYQTMMGYTAWAAGIAVAPRGLGAILAMPIVAVLTSRMDNRYLIAAGFVGLGGSAMWMSGLTLGISQWSLLAPIILSGFAAGFVFVPLSTTSMGTLTNEQIGNASGLYNLIRNVGAGIGISLVSTLIARHEQIHRSELSRYMAGGQVMQSAYGTLRGMLSSQTDPNTAGAQAFAILDRSLNQQATIYAYVDDLRYMVIACAIGLPLAFLLRKVKPRRAAPAAH